MPGVRIANRLDIPLEGPYSTYFGFTENPLSDAGRWINGGAAGYQDCRCTPGLCFGVGTSPSPPYDDPIATLSGEWGQVQTVEAIVKVPASPSGFQEVELYTLTTIDPVGDTIKGYQFLWSVTGNPYMGIYRNTGPNGSASDFVELILITGPQLVTGNRIKATVDRNGLLSAYLDTGSGYGSPIAQATDTVFRTGAPGLGFYSTVTPLGFGLSYFSAMGTV